MGYVVLIYRKHGREPSALVRESLAEAVDLAQRLIQKGKEVAGVAGVGGATFAAPELASLIRQKGQRRR
ncbi:hypothetical protein [Chelatococcus reniformis]|uniref:Uncharacterized protein n=1 Tax=Chelatococcus reniformis TaxID=1494448 RepID=A0A916UUT1_9HYPH|nr:hypothetical protein [Chelatococcus reniformis]GGC87823.1 hypothetical protein GCM10010994_52260 [Chelatococcus reniformis]